ncbi:MAG: DNA polymerase Y family protein [Acidobacteria bacterium]|nr:MAG: DNA polymerase Y family protein [Acidobacteriota bacterium]
MDRLACVDVPALPLQLLVKRHPEWAGRPVAVVDRDHPQGRILWADERARRARILPGMRYAAALAIDGDLRAGVVERAEIESAVRRLTRRLQRFSPHVEPSAGEPGLFWLDAGGLERLQPSLLLWARRIVQALREIGFRARIAVGFTRFGTYAATRLGREVLVFADPGAEQDQVRHVPLAHLRIDPALREALDRLGVRTVGAFLELPAGGLFERFGDEAHRLHRLASGAAWAPLAPAPPREPLVRRAELDHPEGDLERLLFLVKRLLDPLLAELATRGQALVRLAIELKLDAGGVRREEVRPAAPTLDAAQILELTRLRLASCCLPSGVAEIALTARGRPATPAQLRLFADNPRRDPRAASRALARVRAEFGEAAVARARLAEGHLPEARFLWEPLERFPSVRRRDPSGQEAGAMPPMTLVRDIERAPQALPPRPHHLRDDGWLIRGAGHGAVTRFIGPYVVSGGWWRKPIHREYHFAETRRGDLLWVYYDRPQRRWFLHGHVL